MSALPTLSEEASVASLSSETSASVSSSTFLVVMVFCTPSVSRSWSANSGGLFRVSSATPLSAALGAVFFSVASSAALFPSK